MKFLLTCNILISSISFSFAQQTFDLNLSAQTPQVSKSAAVNSALQDRLYDLIGHYHNVQRAHWNVTGP